MKPIEQESSHSPKPRSRLVCTCNMSETANAVLARERIETRVTATASKMAKTGNGRSMTTLKIQIEIETPTALAKMLQAENAESFIASDVKRPAYVAALFFDNRDADEGAVRQPGLQPIFHLWQNLNEATNELLEAYEELRLASLVGAAHDHTCPFAAFPNTLVLLAELTGRHWGI